MKVATKAYGLIEVNEHQKINVPDGLFGFETLTEYVLLDADRQPFYWLQSLEVEQVAFVLVNPFLFRPDYEVNISNDELAGIGIRSPEKALTGRQSVLSDARWKTKHDIMAELAAVHAAAGAGN